MSGWTSGRESNRAIESSGHGVIEDIAEMAVIESSEDWISRTEVLVKCNIKYRVT